MRGRRIKARQPDETIAFARELREHTTDAEHLLWQLVRDRRLLDAKFRRQHPWPPYTLDFYCPDARLVIELDGGQHNDPVEQAKDAERSQRLESNGLEVLRFWNNEVLAQTESVLEQIHTRLLARLPAAHAEATLPHPQPFSRGRREPRHSHMRTTTPPPNPAAAGAGAPSSASRPSGWRCCSSAWTATPS
ncbi:endonuclease domain-containing protein [Chitinimonas koreensis]|uniref:endonuclease domain-containing protein n=1 Tax=Chitinimonas koreensis TaxID=356302 RepID=UPI00223F809D|nr:endonuclease domain-containing protein [Chitinimonas koreensis]